MAIREGQVIEILFDADMWLSPADWTEPDFDASHPIPFGPINTSLPFARRCSTASSISSASPLQLSPTLPSSAATYTRESTPRTCSRPNAPSRTCSWGRHTASLFLSRAPAGSSVVQQALGRSTEHSQIRELKLVKELASRKSAQKLQENIVKTVPGTQAGLFKGVMRRFR